MRGEGDGGRVGGGCGQGVGVVVLGLREREAGEEGEEDGGGVEFGGAERFHGDRPCGGIRASW